MREQQIEWRNFGVPMAEAPPVLAPPTLPGLLAVGAIGSLVAALLLCCLLSMRIAAERQRLERLDGAIASARQDVALLRKDVAIRARYRELDRWNAVLRLAPPRADQYLAGETALAAYSPRRPRALG